MPDGVRPHVSKPSATLMVQGTSSSAGKSLLVAGLCRLFRQDGMSVAPFKAQNMSNNAFVTHDGLEIGRAQAVQAKAARLRPHVDMNPVLLKPEADNRSQVVVMGKPLSSAAWSAYDGMKEHVWGEVVAALDRLRHQHDVVIMEGAGSPAEINLKARDIANMQVALHAQAPVLIVGDIDRGGVFAHFYGTHALLEPDEQALVKGFVINRFRGDRRLLDPALHQIEELTGVPVLGVIPWIEHHGIPEEDAVAIERRRGLDAGSFGGVDVAVVAFPRIANFDDFDPLEAEDDVRVRFVDRPAVFGDPDLVVLPGTKSTMADVEWLRERGLDACLRTAQRRGAAIVGVCGGYQALGSAIEDDALVEAKSARTEGLGLLRVHTRFGERKVTRQSAARVTAARGLLAGLRDAEFTGYEIHAGSSMAEDDVAAVLAGTGDPVGALDESGWVLGCYLHGLFHTDHVRQVMLANIAARRGRTYRPSPPVNDDAAFDALADVLRSSLDVQAIRDLLRQSGS